MQQKTAFCFETLLQDEFRSDVARLTTYVQTCLATNQVAAGFEKWLQKVLRVLRAQGKRFFAASAVTPVYGVTLT